MNRSMQELLKKPLRSLIVFVWRPYLKQAKFKALTRRLKLLKDYIKWKISLINIRALLPGDSNHLT